MRCPSAQTRFCFLTSFLPTADHVINYSWLLIKTNRLTHLATVIQTHQLIQKLVLAGHLTVTNTIHCNLQVSVDAAAVMKERDDLAARLQQLEADHSKAASLPAAAAVGDEPTAEAPSEQELQGNARSLALLRKLAEKQGEIHRLKVPQTEHSFSP